MLRLALNGNMDEFSADTSQLVEQMDLEAELNQGIISANQISALL
jgi:hypothetical protein